MSRSVRLWSPALLRLFGALALGEALQLYLVRGSVDSDFFGLWSWSRFVAAAGVAGLYDPAAQRAFQSALDPSFAHVYPFLYPPIYLLFIWPLGHFGLGPARLLWSVATLAGFVAAVCRRPWRLEPVIGACVAPATVLCLICGQNGLLTAALMLGGLRLAPARPLVGGALLGLLSYKPHLALLVPVGLAFAGLWRALAAAAASSLGAALLSAAVFGTDLWRAWFAARVHGWQMVDGFIGEHQGLVPTVSAALRQLGAGADWVLAGQVAAGLAAAAAVGFGASRRGGPRLMLVPVAALLATPYAFLYDLPMVTGALLLLGSGPMLLIDRIVMLAGIMLPELMFLLPGARVPLAAPLLALLLWWLLRPGWAGGASAPFEAGDRCRSDLLLRPSSSLLRTCASWAAKRLQRASHGGFEKRV